MSDSYPKGGIYGSGPLRSREGISARSVASSSGGGDVQLQIDPMHVDLDDRISVLHRQIGQLKGVALEIETEAKLQNNLLAQLQNTMTKAQAGLKNNMRRLNKRIFQQGSNHVVHVVMFALLCFFLVYLWSKFSKI
ncbi:bet1-like protein At4g14600 [Wolffia australiana]